MSLHDIYIDIVEFDSIVDANHMITEDAMDKYEKAFSLYKNDYLEENDYSWSLSRRGAYSQKFYKLANALVEYYMIRDDHAAAERILQILLEKFPLYEAAHQMLLKLYFIRKDRAAFVTHYQAMRKLFKAELGIEPGDSIKALYRSMLCG
jgi:two-component SAPR family response regulator